MQNIASKHYYLNAANFAVLYILFYVRWVYCKSPFSKLSTRNATYTGYMYIKSKGKTAHHEISLIHIYLNVANCYRSIMRKQVNEREVGQSSRLLSLQNTAECAGYAAVITFD